MTAQRKPVALPRRIWAAIAVPIVALVLALLIGSIVMVLSSALIANKGFDPGLPLAAYGAMFSGAFGGVDAVVGTLVFSAPLMLAGLGVALGFRAGLFNIGAQGQFLVGALGAVAVGGVLHDAPAIAAIPLSIVAGMACGAAWGGAAGFLKATSGAHEVVTTIMMNYIALSVLSWAASGPLKPPGSPLPVTADVGAAALPILFGRNGHLGVAIAFLAVPIVWFFLFRTVKGFEVRTVGANSEAARYAGMHPKVVTVLTMGLAGMMAGLAGAGDLLGINHQMSASYGTTVGFDSITVALLGRSHPVGVMLSALLFGAMRNGSGQMQVLTRLPTELVDVVEAVLLLFLVIGPVLGRVLGLGSGAAGIETGGGAIAPAAAGKAAG